MKVVQSLDDKQLFVIAADGRTLNIEELIKKADRVEALEHQVTQGELTNMDLNTKLIQADVKIHKLAVDNTNIMNAAIYQAYRYGVTLVQQGQRITPMKESNDRRGEIIQKLLGIIAQKHPQAMSRALSIVGTELIAPL
jgi:hypothetical protein